MEKKTERDRETAEPVVVRPWKNDVIVALLLAGFAFWINRGIAIKGLYMDDLYLWSCYGEQSFSEFVFPMGSTRFRFLYYLAAWLQLAVTGNHVDWFVPMNILLNIGVAFTLYRMARSFSRSTYVGALCGIAYLASRMSAYQIAQVYGLMETMALWMAIGILYLLYGYLNEKGGRGKNRFWAACLLYFGICFVHERYMVLLPLFLFVLVCRKARDWRVWTGVAGSFFLVQAIRMATIGGLSPAGTGGTNVADGFSITKTVGYAFSQVLYLFGINAGPEHLNGQNFQESPLWVLMLVAVADLMLVLLVVAFVAKLIGSGLGKEKKCGSYLCTSLLFLGFIAGCIACSSVTIRVELRWVYVSFAAALLFLSWLYGALTDGMVERGLWIQAVPYLGMITVFVALMLPVELYYRGLYPNLYFWSNQSRYNSLAEETYEKYGDEIFGKTIYIIGNDYEMSDFTARTFFKVYDEERLAEGTSVVHIEDVRDIGLVTDEMLILREEPEFEGFQDITQAVRELKCRSIYGYYEDGWLDERAEVAVMAGSTGVVTMKFFYPGELTGEEWMTVYVNGEPQMYLGFDSNDPEVSLELQPFETVNLRFETNFYVPDAREQRGERRLAVLMSLTAD